MNEEVGCAMIAQIHSESCTSTSPFYPLELTGNFLVTVIKNNCPLQFHYYRVFSYFRMSFSALFRFVSQDKKGEAVKIWYPPVLRPVPDFDRLSKPVPSLGNILSLSRCPRTIKALLSFCLKLYCTLYPKQNIKSDLAPL